ncbi:hypothetical protein [Mesorhizobium sp.]|uniref:hypothetical protein n=1 Tax=Mesorhizobium sp. TaxID=1871066 RepID=UPI000FE54883|nr:hypothetical protein [Mesorhizobium sp.]RWL09265.1 MAG: hypothetical protein EOR56_23735 [Mesorhizobium sp.]
MFTLSSELTLKLSGPVEASQLPLVRLASDHLEHGSTANSGRGSEFYTSSALSFSFPVAGFSILSHDARFGGDP